MWDVEQSETIVAYPGAHVCDWKGQQDSLDTIVRLSPPFSAIHGEVLEFGRIIPQQLYETTFSHAEVDAYWCTGEVT